MPVKSNRQITFISLPNATNSMEISHQNAKRRWIPAFKSTKRPINTWNPMNSCNPMPLFSKP